MRFNFTNHHRTFGKDSLTNRNNSIKKLVRTVLCVSIFCFTLVIANAQTMWTQSRTGVASAASQFKVSFNITNGSLRIETFAHHPDYWMQALSHYMAYLRSATLSFTTDRVNWTPFFQFGNIQSTVAYTFFLPPYNQVSNTTQVDNAQIRYIDLYLDNNMKNIKAIKIDFEMWGEICCGNHDQYNGSDIKDITIPQISAINTPTYDFVTVQSNGVYVPKARVSYTKITLNEMDNRSAMVLNESSPPQDKRLTEYQTVATSGWNDVSTSNSAKNYYYQQLIYNERWYTSSAVTAVPAFTVPTSASATYDPVSQQATFSWTIDPVVGNNFVNDKFKIQIANNANFTDAREVSVDYDPVKSSFSYTVDKDFSPQMYFRVARAHVGFNWELAKQASTTVSFTSIPSTATAVLQNSKTALLTWTPLASAWIPGSTLVLTRINNTAKTQNEIKLNKQDFDKGAYTDVQISTCNSYNYTLQVMPPVGSSFTAFAPVQITGEILPTEIGSLINLEVSKGYFPDRTELRWSTSGSFDNFIIKRAVYGTTNFVQVATVPGSINSEYQTEDAKGTPGVYYSYQVIGAVKCNNTTVFSNETLTGIGFRSPTGNIYGRITYENGQAVEDVAVRLQSNSQVQIGKSVYLDGTPNSYLQVDTKIPFSDTAFTIEAWIKPDIAHPHSQIIFSGNDQYFLGFNASGNLVFSYLGASVEVEYSNPNNSFVHVTGIHSKDSLFVMLNTNVIGRIALPYVVSYPDNIILIGRSRGGNSFQGFLDEMRIYNRAISLEEAVKNQTRLFSGDEPGLAAYWRFDETITDQFYDLSFHGDTYNRNDGTMNGTAVIRSGVIPTEDQLALRSYTDISGNYFIAGIPYIGNGTTYTIVPLKGTHQFDPISVNRLISPSSTQFAVDFKDKSSFPVSGFVYYKNTTVPVPGVFFQVDGQYAQRSNGELIQTDDNGAFTISVPVGVHEVKAEKADHGFANGGKITDRDGKNLNYQDNISGLELTDTTTIRFIGRVAGGAVQQDQPLGHSLSVNNLGKEITLTMELPPAVKGRYRLNLAPNDSSAVVNHFLPSNIQDSSKISKTQVTYTENSIVIQPDPKTGEFVADLIPVKFVAAKAEVTGWGDLLDGKPVQLDFSNKFFKQSSTRSYVDSALTDQNTYVKTNYVDSLAFNTSYRFIKRVTPTIEIVQKDGLGRRLPYIGNLNYESLSLLGKKDTIQIVDTTKQGIGMYLFGKPVFLQNQLYTFDVKAFEKYPYYESVGSNGVPVVKQEGGIDVLDNVPTTDGFVSVLNSIRNGETAADTFSLNSKGTAEYQFIGGDPELLFGLRQLSAKVRFGEATVVNWTLNGATAQDVFVMGGKLTGTDFVTAGPDKLLMVLRDPPGSKSFSYAEKSSAISRSVTYSGSVDQTGSIDIGQFVGTKMMTFIGLGAGKINKLEAGTTTTYGIEHEEHFTHTNTKEETTTLTTRFQTSDDPLFAGPIADVFVGYSTNITYGASNNVTIIKKVDQSASDQVLFEPANSPYIVIKREGISIGEQFGTLFAFPQQHIEKILIPNLINIRNSILLPPATQPADAQSLANSTLRPVYVSKIAIAENFFGRSNWDTVAFGVNAKSAPFGDGPSYKIYFPATSLYRTDTIMALNQYVSNWKKRMADNEKAKLESDLIQNYSFHAGSPIAHSRATSLKENTVNAFNFILSGVVTNNTEVKFDGIGLEFKTEEKIGTSQGGDVTTNSEASTTLGFNLASNGTDDYFSIDLRRAPDQSLVFLTKGGVSACPYMGATYSMYYQPGALIDQPTQRIEVPVLSVDKPIAANIPASRKAVYTLTLRNESEAKLPATFVIGYTDNDAIKGATIAVDGAPIGGYGRAVYLQFGESVTKVLTLTKGPDAMDYENIQILLHSSCQYDPTSYQDKIGDTVLISAHFIPSCSDINIKSPKDKWVLNSESPKNEQGKRYLPIIIDQFDVNNTLFDHIALQYKPASSSTWVTFMKFYADSAKLKDAEGEKALISNAQGINYNFVLDEGSFSDQNYDIQAVSYCKVGNDYVTTESNLISGIKDTYNPRLFGTPQPADGVLNVNDDVRLNFNETIAAGLLTNSDFQVTGVRNGVKGDHAVSIKFDGVSNYLATEFEKSFTGKNITTEMWILPSTQADQTVFSHGAATESLELALTSDNKMQITAGSKVIKSVPAYDYRPGEWAHVALVYNDQSKTVSAFYNFVEMIHGATVSSYSGTGHIEYGRSISKQNNYFSGKMHEARIWNDTLNSIKLQVNSLSMLSGAENSLIAYYPMNEGKGLVVFDKAHGSNAQLNGLWSTPAGKAISLNGNGYVKLNTSFAPVLAAMDYTMEMWFKGDAAQTNTTLASNGRGDGTEFGGSLNLFNLGFEGGRLTFQNNSFKVQATGNYLDNKWHHVAIAVNRNSGSAQMLVDGELNQFFDAKDLGGIESATTFLGVRSWYGIDATTVPKYDRYFKGYIDEFRIWNTYMNQTLVSKNNNVRLMGNELGLMAYYPFENYEMFQGNTSLYFSLKDAKVQEVANTFVPDATTLNAVTSDEAAPMKDHGPVANLKFDFVVNNDALIINVLEPKQSIDKTIITFQSKNVRDLNGNKVLSPVSWTAYIDQNQLKWSDDEINLVKDVNTPLKFESHLVNSGGSSQQFTLSNLPSWLNANPSNGTVDPKGNLKIEFTVNEGLNIGSYEEIIFMRNDNNETEALKLTLQVKGKKPGWIVKASDYQYNMAVYGKIRLNNLFSVNKEDMLAAFVGGKCVGVSNNTYNSSNNLWYAFLTVYSNDVSNNNVEFRIWQASTGKTFKATPASVINFADNAIIGTATVPVIFDGSTMLYQDITVNENWNWISFNLLIPVNTPVSTTLANGNWTSNDLIKHDLTGFSNYTNTNWVGSLKSLDNISLFKLKATNAQSLTVNGIPVNVTTTPIPLKGARWNYISYLPQVNATIKEALAGYKAVDEDVIKSQTGFAMYSAQNGWIGSLNYLEPGKGYMLYRKRSTDTAFHYPVINGSLSGGKPAGAIIPNADQRPVPGNYSSSNNMTIAAIIAPGFEFRNDDNILAYVNGEVRGKAKPILNPEINKFTWFFNIGGEAEQSIVFMIERGGSIVAQSSTVMNYRTNSVIGTLTKPVELHFVKQAGVITVYPNPFNSTISVSADLRGQPATGIHEIQVSVVDLAGRLVWKGPIQKVSGSGYKTTWNGENAEGNPCAAGVYFIRMMVNGIPHIYKVIKQ